MKTLPRVVGFLLVVGTLPSVWGQTVPPAELLLFTQEELAVTATRTTKPVSESPSATTVITREEIHRSGLWHIPDLLRRVPGVDVTSTTASHSEVNIRGLNRALSPRTLVLVDGRTVFINGQGFTPWEAIPLFIEDVERVEVVKGPVQALYGSPALSGVVNIITRSLSDVKGIEIYQRYGSHRLLEDSIAYGGRLNDSLAYKMMGGWRSWNAFEGANTDAIDRSTWTGALEWKMPEQGTVGLSGGIADGDFDILPSDATGIGPMKHRSEFSKLDLNVGGFHGQYFWNRYYFNVTTTNIDEDLTVNTHDLDLSQQVAVGPHTVLGGFGVRYEQIDSNLFRSAAETKSVTTWDLFAQDEWRLWGPLTWFGTVRLDRDPITDYNIAFRSSLLYEPVENHVIWGTIGRTFRNPTFSESKIDLTFPTLANPIASTRSLGNEDLKAERMNSYEVGYRSLWRGRFKFETSMFLDRADDLSNTIAGTPGLVTPTTFLNRGKAMILGTEIGGELFVCPWLSTFGSWSYQDVEREDSFSENDLSPQHKATLGFNSTYKGFSGELFMQFVDTTDAPNDRTGLASEAAKVAPYWWTSARAGYAFNDHAELAVTVYNLFHDVHQEHAGGQELSSRIVVQADLKF